MKNSTAAGNIVAIILLLSTLTAYPKLQKILQIRENSEHINTLNYALADSIIPLKEVIPKYKFTLMFCDPNICNGTVFRNLEEINLNVPLGVQITPGIDPELFNYFFEDDYGNNSFRIIADYGDYKIIKFNIKGYRDLKLTAVSIKTGDCYSVSKSIYVLDKSYYEGVETVVTDCTDIAWKRLPSDYNWLPIFKNIQG